MIQQPDDQLLQLRVLRLGLFQDGNVGVGVFPEGEEILVCGEGFERSAEWGEPGGSLQNGFKALRPYGNGTRYRFR